jgi:hypothetical protein
VAGREAAEPVASLPNWPLPARFASVVEPSGGAVLPTEWMSTWNWVSQARSSVRTSGGLELAAASLAGVGVGPAVDNLPLVDVKPGYDDRCDLVWLPLCNLMRRA